MVKLLIKKLQKNIILPEYKTDGSSGMDLMANVEQTVKILPGEKKNNFYRYNGSYSRTIWDTNKT